MSTVSLSPYDPRWPERFAEERQRIAGACAPTAVRVEHVGSTAVPGLAAKPVLDCLVGLNSLEREGSSCVAALVRAGYRYKPEFEESMPFRRYFTRNAPDGTRIANVHMVEVGSRFWRATLAFRDALRADRELREGYEAAKRHAVEVSPDDVHRYNDAKAPFIHRVLATLDGLSPDVGE